jgi:hypothetical protein
MLELKKTMQSLDSQPPHPLTEHANSQYHPEMLTNELPCLVRQQTHNVISCNGMMSILKQLKNAKTAAPKPHKHNVLLRSMLLLTKKIKT